MGCCEENLNHFSSMEFYLELFTLEPNKNGNVFTIKRLESIKVEKMAEKTLRIHIIETGLTRSQGEQFKFTIDNALFYCYLNENPIV